MSHGPLVHPLNLAVDAMCCLEVFKETLGVSFGCCFVSCAAEGSLSRASRKLYLWFFLKRSALCSSRVAVL